MPRYDFHKNKNLIYIYIYILYFGDYVHKFWSFDKNTLLSGIEKEGDCPTTQELKQSATKIREIINSKEDKEESKSSNSEKPE
jgi:hypothetical protein